MLERNHLVAQGYEQSRWAEIHGGDQDKAWPRCFHKTAAPEKSSGTLLWLACHPAQNHSTLEFNASLLLSWEGAPGSCPHPA